MKRTTRAQATAVGSARALVPPLQAVLSMRYSIFDQLMSTPFLIPNASPDKIGLTLEDRPTFVKNSFAAEVSFLSDWDYDDYHLGGSSTITISGPDDGELFSIADDFACSVGEPACLDVNKGKCDAEAIDSLLDVLDIENIARSTFMDILSLCMELLLFDRLVDSEASPIVQGGSLVDMVIDAVNSIEDVDDDQPEDEDGAEDGAEDEDEPVGSELVFF